MVGCRETGEAAVVDPAWDVPAILGSARENELRITRILLTHNHADHTNGVAEVQERDQAIRGGLGFELREVDIDGDESHRLGFDVETGLLTRLGYNRELRDYEKVDGVLVPRRVAISRKGGSSTYYLDSIAHNTTLDRAIFSLAK